MRSNLPGFLQCRPRRARVTQPQTQTQEKTQTQQIERAESDGARPASLGCAEHGEAPLPTPPAPFRGQLRRHGERTRPRGRRRGVRDPRLLLFSPQPRRALGLSARPGPGGGLVARAPCPRSSSSSELCGKVSVSLTRPPGAPRTRPPGRSGTCGSPGGEGEEGETSSPISWGQSTTSPGRPSQETAAFVTREQGCSLR